MKTPLETKIDKLIADNPKLLKPLLIKAIKTLEFYGMGDYKFGPESIQLNLVKLMEDDGKLSRETLQEINNALGGV